MLSGIEFWRSNSCVSEANFDFEREFEPAHLAQVQSLLSEKGFRFNSSLGCTTLVSYLILLFRRISTKPFSSELLAGQISNLKENFSVLLNCSRREVFHAKYSIIDGKPEARTLIQLTSLEMFLDASKDKAVVLHRVNPERRKAEPLFSNLKLLSLDYPVADALLLDRIGAHKLKSDEINFNAPANPLYVKRDVEKRN